MRENRPPPRTRRRSIHGRHRIRARADPAPRGEGIQVGPELLRGEPFVARAACEQYERECRALIQQQFRRDVAANRDHSRGGAPAAKSGSERHRHSLGKTRVDDLRGPVMGDRVERSIHVLDVVGDGRIAILPGHPAGHDLFAAPAVEPVQGLDRDERPSLRSGNGLQPLHLDDRLLHVAMEADEHAARRGCPRVAHEHATMGRGSDEANIRVGGHSPLPASRFPLPERTPRRGYGEAGLPFSPPASMRPRRP